MIRAPLIIAACLVAGYLVAAVLTPGTQPSCQRGTALVWSGDRAICVPYEPPLMMDPD